MMGTAQKTEQTARWPVEQGGTLSFDSARANPSEIDGQKSHDWVPEIAWPSRGVTQNLVRGPCKNRKGSGSAGPATVVRHFAFTRDEKHCTSTRQEGWNTEDNAPLQRGVDGRPLESSSSKLKFKGRWNRNHMRARSGMAWSLDGTLRESIAALGVALKSTQTIIVHPLPATWEAERRCHGLWPSAYRALSCWDVEAC